MKLLYVIEGISQKGGLERILVDKMNALVETACDTDSITLLTVWKGQETPAYRLDSRITHYSLDIPQPQGRVGFLLALARILRRYNQMLSQLNPDVVIHFRAIGAFLIGYANHQCRTIFESHGVRYSNNHLWLYPRMERRVDTIVCLTQGDRAEYLSLGRSRDVRVIPNFSNLRPVGIPDYSNQHCIFIGRYCPQKAPDRLLALWKRINQNHPDWKLDIYGDGWPQMSEDSICCHGRTENVAAAMHRGSILLLTSHTEGFGLCILEAMKCALPVVSLDTPYGPSDLIENGVTGFCTPYHDDQAFVHATETLIQNQTLRQQMGQAGQQRAQRYDQLYIIPQWLGIFRH